MCLGIPGKITEITDREHQLAMVNIGGVQRQVNIACIIDQNHPIDTCVNDWVLVHVGFAMNRLDEQEAAETLQLLQELALTE
ncbi:MAG: HypC/HybG/HupF family hydrogenase formation chaperone [Coleofasciculus sp.]